jgi:phage terminase small subunit
MIEKAPKVDIPPSAEDALTVRELRFCEEFVIDLHATRAAARAGYSRRTARTIGSRLLQKPHVATVIDQLIAERSERTRVTADRVVQELAVVAFSDMRDFAANESGQMRLSAGAPSHAARAVAAIKRRRRTDSEGITEATVEFRLWNKLEALRQLAPHVGLVTSRTELTGKAGDPIAHFVRVIREGADAPTPPFPPKQPEASEPRAATGHMPSGDPL